LRKLLKLLVEPLESKLIDSTSDRYFQEKYLRYPGIRDCHHLKRKNCVKLIASCLDCELRALRNPSECFEALRNLKKPFGILSLACPDHQLLSQSWVDAVTKAEDNSMHASPPAFRLQFPPPPKPRSNSMLGLISPIKTECRMNLSQSFEGSEEAETVAYV
jgi:hypothetical protein